MTWTARTIPDQTGRIAVVTGANGGLGLETARELARAGAHVVMAVRDTEKADRAVTAITTEIPAARLELVALDLGSLASVRAAADTIAAEHDHVDILVNNAGVMGVPEQQTADGFEMQLGVNHIGHFALTSHLMPSLLRAAAARVVSVTSSAHHFGRAVDPRNPHLEGTYEPWAAYNRSKLANYHFAIGLHRIFGEAGVRAASLLAHPGLSNTDLQATSVAASSGGRSQRFWHVMAERTGMSPAVGALPQLRAATDPRATSGQFYAPRYVTFGPPVQRPIMRRLRLDEAIRRLWEVSEDATGVTLDVSTLQRAMP